MRPQARLPETGHSAERAHAMESENGIERMRPMERRRISVEAGAPTSRAASRVTASALSTSAIGSRAIGPLSAGFPKRKATPMRRAPCARRKRSPRAGEARPIAIAGATQRAGRREANEKAARKRERRNGLIGHSMLESRQSRMSAAMCVAAGSRIEKGAASSSNGSPRTQRRRRTTRQAAKRGEALIALPLHATPTFCAASPAGSKGSRDRRATNSARADRRARAEPTPGRQEEAIARLPVSTIGRATSARLVTKGKAAKTVTAIAHGVEKKSRATGRAAKATGRGTKASGVTSVPSKQSRARIAPSASIAFASDRRFHKPIANAWKVSSRAASAREASSRPASASMVLSRAAPSRVARVRGTSSLGRLAPTGRRANLPADALLATEPPR